MYRYVSAFSFIVCLLFSADQQEILSNDQPVVAVGYLMFKHFGDLLGHDHDEEIRSGPTRFVKGIRYFMF